MTARKSSIRAQLSHIYKIYKHGVAPPHESCFLAFSLSPWSFFLISNPALVFTIVLRIIRQQNLLLTVLFTWQLPLVRQMTCETPQSVRNVSVSNNVDASLSQTRVYLSHADAHDDVYV